MHHHQPARREGEKEEGQGAQGTAQAQGVRPPFAPPAHLPRACACVRVCVCVCVRQGYLFAFNDILLVTRSAKGGYKVIDRLDMDQTKLEEPADSSDSFPIALTQNNRKYVFAIPTLIEKVRTTAHAHAHTHDRTRTTAHAHSQVDLGDWW